MTHNFSIYSVNTTFYFDNSTRSAHDIFQSPWLFGIGVSFACILLQAGILAFKPICRKYDEKILFQLSVARVLNSTFEYIVMCIQMDFSVSMCFVFTMMFVTDCALLLWMVVFTSNLYQKVAIILVVDNRRTFRTSLVVWFFSLIVGVTIELTWIYRRYQKLVHEAYEWLKVIVIVVNLYLFYRIFRSTFKKEFNDKRNIADYLRACMIFFLLVCTMGLQLLGSELLALMYEAYMEVIFLFFFCVVNAWQVVLVTVVFIILATRKVRDKKAHDERGLELSESLKANKETETRC